MKKEKIDNLYFAKCRFCVMDIMSSYYFDDEEIIPRPDYVDYYTIIKKNKDGSYTDVFVKNGFLIKYSDFEYINIEEYYNADIIFSLEPLSNYVKSYGSLNKRECLIVLDMITEMYNLNTAYGYKHYYNIESYDLELDNERTSLKRTNKN